jgi:hypothetical protein
VNDEFDGEPEVEP